MNENHYYSYKKNKKFHEIFKKFMKFFKNLIYFIEEMKDRLG